MSSFESDFLGRGWSFPPEFKKEEGAVMLANEDDIKSSLEVLVSTSVGERILQPEYGCNVENLLFEPVTLSLQAYLKDLVFTAVYLYEPRVDPLDVSLITLENEGIVNIEITYVVRATNTRYNLVYPFYLNEAKITVQ